MVNIGYSNNSPCNFCKIFCWSFWLVIVEMWSEKNKNVPVPFLFLSPFFFRTAFTSPASVKKEVWRSDNLSKGVGIEFQNNRPCRPEGSSSFNRFTFLSIKSYISVLFLSFTYAFLNASKYKSPQFSFSKCSLKRGDVIFFLN